MSITRLPPSHTVRARLYADTIVGQAAYTDEFLSATLDPKWSLHGFTTGDIGAQTDREYDNPVIAFVSDAGGDAVYQAAPAGDFTLYVVSHGVNSNGGMPSVLCVDTSGTGMGFSSYNDGNSYLWFINSWQYSSTGNAVTQSPPWRYGAANVPFVLRLVKSGTSWTGAVSGDGGASWMSTSPQTNSFTVAYVGFGRIFGGSGGTMTWQINRFVLV